MTSPFHLHAVSASWSLATALDQLDQAATLEARAIAAQTAAAAEPLRSPSWGRRTALGGHGDPTGDAILAAGITGRRNRYAELYSNVLNQLYGVARHLPAVAFNPLHRIREHLPAMLPGTAAVTTTLLAKLDDRVRRELRIGPDRQLLSGVPCPACGRRLLYAQTAGPEDAWTVVCGAGCVCTGQGCPCGMPGAVEGVAHIWPRSVVLGAVAGAASPAA